MIAFAASFDWSNPTLADATYSGPDKERIYFELVCPFLNGLGACKNFELKINQSEKLIADTSIPEDIRIQARQYYDWLHEFCVDQDTFSCCGDLSTLSAAVRARIKYSKALESIKDKWRREIDNLFTYCPAPRFNCSGDLASRRNFIDRSLKMSVLLDEERNLLVEEMHFIENNCH